MRKIFTNNFDFLQKKLLYSRLPPLYSIEINHIYTSHIAQKRNSIKYLHLINKNVLKNNLKSENIIDKNNFLIDEYILGNNNFAKASIFELSNLRKISNLSQSSHDYCQRNIAFYSSRFVIINNPNLNLEVDPKRQKIFEGHSNKIGAFSIHPKSILF